MPVYEFACQECGNTFSEFYHVTEKQKTICGECGKDAVVQLIGKAIDWNPASAVFNGKWGWVEKRVQAETRNPKKDRR